MQKLIDLVPAAAAAIRSIPVWVIVLVNILMILLIVLSYVLWRRDYRRTNKITNRYNEDGTLKAERGAHSTNVGIFIMLLVIADLIVYLGYVI